MEVLLQTQYYVRPNIDIRISHNGNESNCLFGYDAVYHDTNLESGGDSFLQNFGDVLQDYAV